VSSIIPTADIWKCYIVELQPPQCQDPQNKQIV